MCAVILGLVYFKVLHPNDMFYGSYEMQGVDVSSYQGEIDWKVMSPNIDFAFIKATEGSERERYAAIYTKLILRKNYCTDDLD